MTEQEINAIRAGIQFEAMKSVEDNNGRGLLVMATGAGKSKIPIDYAKKHKVKSIALIVPTEKLRDDDWKQEFIKWEAEELWEVTTRLCYASGSKIESQEFDLVILDECHNITDLSSSFFMNNDCKDIIGLTATPPTEFDKQGLLRDIGLKQTYYLPLDKAVELGFVAPYKITIVYTKLNEVDKNVKAGNKQNPFYQTEWANYNWLNNQIITMEHNQDYGPKYQAMILKRMRAIYNLQSKLDTAKYILNSLPEDDRVLVFAGSIDHAEQISPNTYHSKSKKDSLNKFINEEINLLSAVNALNEGTNIPNLDKAVIIQLSSKERHLVQRIGRLIRYRPGHEAHIYIIVCQGTQDEVWLSKAVENIDKSIIDFMYL